MLLGWECGDETAESVLTCIQQLIISYADDALCCLMRPLRPMQGLMLDELSAAAGPGRATLKGALLGGRGAGLLCRLGNPSLSWWVGLLRLLGRVRPTPHISKQLTGSWPVPVNVSGEPLSLTAPTSPLAGAC